MTWTDPPPDQTEHFAHAGLNCKITRIRRRHWCGYVQRPDGLGAVRWTADYDSYNDEIKDADVDVWGGITYGPDGEGWVGFDDAHSRDLVDHREHRSAKHAVKNETKRLAEQIAQLETDET